MNHQPLTILSFGYWGWGNETQSLLTLVDDFEKECGFCPPLWVDIRYQRNVRAEGFKGNAFEKLVGANRYQWMKSLGNSAIGQTGTKEIAIANPSAASDLLRVGFEEMEKYRRRIIFYCACEFPRECGQTFCHRDVVARLLLEEARQLQKHIQVVEWPGGEPEALTCEIDNCTFNAMKGGRKTVPMGQLAPHPRKVVAWGSILELRSPNRKHLPVVVGPARRQGGQWVYPVLAVGEPSESEDQMAAVSQRLREARGLTPRNSMDTRLRLPREN